MLVFCFVLFYFLSLPVQKRKRKRLLFCNFSWVSCVPPFGVVSYPAAFLITAGGTRQLLGRVGGTRAKNVGVCRELGKGRKRSIGGGGV